MDYYGVNNVRKLKRDQFEVGVSSVVFFSSSNGSEGCTRTVGSFQCPSSGFALYALPFLGTGVQYVFYFIFIYFWCTFNSKQRGSRFSLKGVDDERSNFLFCFPTRRDGFSGFRPISLFLFPTTVI